MYSRRLLPLLLLLLRSSICPVKAACRPVEEGQKTTLTCSLGKKTCSTNKFLDWILDSSNTKVIACTTNECGGFHSDYGIYAIVNNNGSTLTILKVTRAGFLNMETKWICRPCTDSRREITACDKLEVYAKPENPTCAARRNMDQAGQFESLTVSCSTTKVYPKARCNFKRRTKGEMFVTINETLTYRHTQTNETPAYYRSECSVDVPVAELGEGTPSFKAFIYPDVTNGIDLVAATTVSAAANINAPFVTFTHNSTSSEYNEGDTPTFTCTAHGNPPPNLTLTRKRTTKQLASVQGNLKTAELTHTMEPLDCLDTDVYVCTGQNKHGVTTKEISIGVKSENEKDLQQLLDIVKEESEKKGLELNRKKTEVMVVSRKQELPISNIYIKGTRLKQKDQFKYLGSLISSDGRNNSEVASRIAQAKTNFQKMKTVLTNKNISIQTRRRALECYIEPILMYGCEAWTISKQTQKKLEATEMWFLRRMLRISWTAKKTNDTVLEEAHTTRLLISKIRKRQATFFGHVMRREKLENLVTTGMLEGKRSRGKQREKLIEGLTDWLKAGKSLEAIEATKDKSGGP
ncbi:endonuclease-reverse transcriptase [Plakobranchus ocellatus]|uniref:Endonuclease-reverse transcriptase n=1 Tax=Plakobranchus ocellatus TaxID=259542 RepID=A0AAV4DRC8_9GAST|nr:endonuclease-reverse transcriptase [Plakobranchus ocellatus]